MAEPPMLTLEYLINDATISDVYDALEMMEIKKYMKIESEKFNNDDKGGSS
ncbi:hypothetical protein [Acinetobacter baumannii]|uniref:hypothetical protein n=1 Tax=Acinetobacter baumannii TaxID=470 RepID=UPI00367030E7